MDIGPSPDAEYVLDLDGHFSGHFSSLMVKSENFDFEKIESFDDVNFSGHLSEQLTTQMSQYAGTITNLLEEEFSFLNEPAEEDFCFYLHPHGNRHTLSPVNELIQGTMSKSAAANKKYRMNKKVTRASFKKAAPMTRRTAGERQAAVIVNKTQETSGSSEPKRLFSATQAPQLLVIVVLLVLLIYSPMTHAVNHIRNTKIVHIF